MLMLNVSTQGYLQQRCVPASPIRKDRVSIPPKCCTIVYLWKEIIEALLAEKLQISMFQCAGFMEMACSTNKKKKFTCFNGT